MKQKVNTAIGAILLMIASCNQYDGGIARTLAKKEKIPTSIIPKKKSKPKDKEGVAHQLSSINYRKWNEIALKHIKRNSTQCFVPRDLDQIILRYTLQPHYEICNNSIFLGEMRLVDSALQSFQAHPCFEQVLQYLNKAEQEESDNIYEFRGKDGNDYCVEFDFRDGIFMRKGDYNFCRIDRENESAAPVWTRERNLCDGPTIRMNDNTLIEERYQNGRRMLVLGKGEKKSFIVFGSVLVEVKNLTHKTTTQLII